jgi:hypothetical protein
MLCIKFGSQVCVGSSKKLQFAELKVKIECEVGDWLPDRWSRGVTRQLKLFPVLANLLSLLTRRGRADEMRREYCRVWNKNPN